MGAVSTNGSSEIVVEVETISLLTAGQDGKGTPVAPFYLTRLWTTWQFGELELCGQGE